MYLYVTLSGSGKRLEDFSYNDTEMADMMTHVLYDHVRFRGLSGWIDFDDHGNPPLDIVIEQQQGSN